MLKLYRDFAAAVVSLTAAIANLAHTANLFAKRLPEGFDLAPKQEGGRP